MAQSSSPPPTPKRDRDRMLMDKVLGLTPMT
jgi:hypothetical protein